MKITIIGAGNVGGLTALRLAQDNAGEVILFDIVKGLAQGKALDMEDARSLLGCAYQVRGTDDISQVQGSDIIVITAGLARKPGMTREELLNKNAVILKGICEEIKKLSPQAIIVVVTNPLDLMTRFVIEHTGFRPQRVIGMGVTLDASRFANLIAQELNVPVTDIEPMVVASHGEGMMPLARFTTVKGKALDKIIDEKKAAALIERTVKRGAEIVGCLGSGSAYVAPSAAISELVKAIAKDKKCVAGVSAFLNGQYGLHNVCIGAPCCIGRQGIEEIIELDFSPQEKETFVKAAQGLQEQYLTITLLK